MGIVSKVRNFIAPKPKPVPIKLEKQNSFGGGSSRGGGVEVGSSGKAVVSPPKPAPKPSPIPRGGGGGGGGSTGALLLTPNEAQNIGSNVPNNAVVVSGGGGGKAQVDVIQKGAIIGSTRGGGSAYNQQEINKINQIAQSEKAKENLEKINKPWVDVLGVGTGIKNSNTFNKYSKRANENKLKTYNPADVDAINRYASTGQITQENANRNYGYSIYGQYGSINKLKEKETAGSNKILETNLIKEADNKAIEIQNKINSGELTYEEGIKQYKEYVDTLDKKYVEGLKNIDEKWMKTRGASLDKSAQEMIKLQNIKNRIDKAFAFKTIKKEFTQAFIGGATLGVAGSGGLFSSIKTGNIKGIATNIGGLGLFFAKKGVGGAVALGATSFSLFGASLQAKKEYINTYKDLEGTSLTEKEKRAFAKGTSLIPMVQTTTALVGGLAGMGVIAGAFKGVTRINYGAKLNLKEQKIFNSLIKKEGVVKYEIVKGKVTDIKAKVLESVKGSEKAEVIKDLNAGYRISKVEGKIDVSKLTPSEKAVINKIKLPKIERYIIIDLKGNLVRQVSVGSVSVGKFMPVKQKLFGMATGRVNEQGVVKGIGTEKTYIKGKQIKSDIFNFRAKGSVKYKPTEVGGLLRAEKGKAIQVRKTIETTEGNRVNRKPTLSTSKSMIVSEGVEKTILLSQQGNKRIIGTKITFKDLKGISSGRDFGTRIPSKKGGTFEFPKTKPPIKTQQTGLIDLTSMPPKPSSPKPTIKVEPPSDKSGEAFRFIFGSEKGGTQSLVKTETTTSLKVDRTGLGTSESIFANQNLVGNTGFSESIISTTQTAQARGGMFNFFKPINMGGIMKGNLIQDREEKIKDVTIFGREKGVLLKESVKFEKPITIPLYQTMTQTGYKSQQKFKQEVIQKQQLKTQQIFKPAQSYKPALFIPQTFTPTIPLPFFGSIQTGGGEKAKPTKGRLVGIARYNPSLGSVLRREKVKKVSAKQFSLLSKRKYTGLESRPLIQIGK